MATIKILPKNIFKVSNFNNLKNNKIKGISGSIADISFATANIGGGGSISWTNGTTIDSIDQKPFVGNWYKTYYTLTIQVQRIKVWEALRYRTQISAKKRALGVQTEKGDYIDYKRLYGKATYNTSMSETITNDDVLKSQYGSYNVDINVPTPTSLGTIKYDYGTGEVTGTVDTNDITTVRNNNITFIENNMFYAINPDTATKTSFEGEFIVPSWVIQLCDFAYYIDDISDGKETPPPDDPATWGNILGGGYIEGQNYGMNNLSTTEGASFMLSSAEISFTTSNYALSTTATNIGQEPFLKFDDNLFFRNDILYSSSNTAYNQLKNKIVNEWSGGKETVTLKCNIGEYYDTSGNLALSTKNNDLPMTFSIGDIVVPYVINGQGQQVPLSKTALGYAKTFKVIDKRLYTDGCCWQEIDLQEATSY